MLAVLYGMGKLPGHRISFREQNPWHMAFTSMLVQAALGRSRVSSRLFSSRLCRGMSKLELPADEVVHVVRVGPERRTSSVGGLLDTKSCLAYGDHVHACMLPFLGPRNIRREPVPGSRGTQDDEILHLVDQACLRTNEHHDLTHGYSRSLRSWIEYSSRNCEARVW